MENTRAVHRATDPVSGHRPVLSENSSVTSLSSVESSTELLDESRRSPKWPKRPLPLKRGTTGFVVRSLIDILLLLATTPFLGLGTYTAVKNGKPVNEQEWSYLQVGMKTAVTTFPIIFAAVMGRLTKNLATWRLERGISLGHLEQLLGSSSVFGTFSTQVLMGSFNMLAIALLCLWALSPLGGQSSLHIVKTIPSVAVASKEIHTFNTEISSPFNAMRQPLAFVGPQLNGLYITSLMAPPEAKSSPTDIWGNLKVPLMSHLTSNRTANETGWYNIDAFAENIPFSSLIGIPVGGLPWNGNTTFTMESSYFDNDCFTLSAAPHVPITENFTAPAGTDLSMTKSKDAPKLVLIPNNTFYGQADAQSSFKFGIDSSVDWRPGYLTKVWDEGMLSFIPNVTDNEKTFFGNKQTFLFESKLSVFPGVRNPATVAYCNIRRVYVESAVHCIGNSSSIRKPQCSVTATRASRKPHPPSDITPFLFRPVLNKFTSSLATSQGQNETSRYSLMEKYLNNTDAPLLVQEVGISLYKLDKVVFSQRLTQVLNTYYMASLFPSAMVGGLDAKLPEYTIRMYSEDPFKRSTIGTVTSLEHNLYTTNPAWLTVFLVTSAVMLLAAVASSLLAFFTHIPDVLGYASSLTRDSAHFPHAAEGSVLDGLVRSRRLKDKKVRLGDVQSNERVGLLAFSETDSAARAEKQKLYQ
ncbi:hypothetical protein AJ78_03908 [Emergomyces pasteurianus Ep9510]|uniref:Uncharacterized protein n=1 Tax=Emergomyces pasteurianus Ep9510 TaxID=1447872 RepID=A0A1J9PJ10_9EURO|nr:hypothetical protein AJ78_03908 [Emergomyces pasteurianus Ep9510]